MNSTIVAVTVDCLEPYRLAGFWTEVVGYPVDPDAKPDDEEVALTAPDGQPILLFVRVPEGKRDEPRTAPGSPARRGTTSSSS